MPPDLRVRAADAGELMDDPDADLRMLERTYARFALVNAIVSRPWRLYRREIRPRARRGPVRILDIGAGGGDLARAIARRLRSDGLAGEVTALDADPRAIAWAASRDAARGVRYRCAMTSELVAEGERYDVVLSNHLLHHLRAAELPRLLADSRRLAGSGGIVVHSDIERSPAAYRMFAAATLPFAANLLAGSFIRPDGLVSIRRSYTAAELSAAAPAGWRVTRAMPSRLMLRWEAPDARS